MIHPLMPFKFPLSSASPPVYGYSEVHFSSYEGRNKIGEGIFHLFFSTIPFLCVFSKLLLQIVFSMQLSIFLLNQLQYTFSLSQSTRIPLEMICLPVSGPLFASLPVLDMFGTVCQFHSVLFPMISLWHQMLLKSSIKLSFPLASLMLGYLVHSLTSLKCSCLNGI